LRSGAFIEINNNMEDNIVKIKSAKIDLSRFKVAPKPKDEPEAFEHWVKQTSELIKRPYFQTFKLVSKWPLEKIIRHYELATKHAGDMPGDVKWWWLRKVNKQ